MFGFLKVDKTSLGIMGFITACTVAEQVLDDRSTQRKAQAKALGDAKAAAEANHEMLLKERAVIVKAIGLKGMSKNPDALTDNEWLELARSQM